MAHSTLPSDVVMPRPSILPLEMSYCADQRLELPGDQPVEQADADGEGRIEEREQHVAEAQQIAAALVGIALGRLRLERRGAGAGRACRA